MLIHELNMNFNYLPIVYGKIRDPRKGRALPKETMAYKAIAMATKKDHKIADVYSRIGEKERCFGHYIVWNENVMNTILGNATMTRGDALERITELDIIHAQTFPEDYNFLTDSWHQICYVCGMSVPPIMAKRVVERLIEEKVFQVKGNK